MTEPVSKSQFALEAGVSPGRVSQWIKEGKIPPDALIGEGQRARIDPDKARASLQRHLDINQRFGLNGLGTRISNPPPEAEQPAAPPPPPVDTIEERIKQTKLEQSLMITDRMRREEQQQAGKLTDTAQARQEMGRIAAVFMAEFEGALPLFADDVAEAFNLPRRDVVLILRKASLKWRASAHERLSATATALPAHVDYTPGEDALPQ